MLTRVHDATRPQAFVRLLGIETTPKQDVTPGEMPGDVPGDGATRRREGGGGSNRLLRPPNHTASLKIPFAPPFSTTLARTKHRAAAPQRSWPTPHTRPTGRPSATWRCSRCAPRVVKRPLARARSRWPRLSSRAALRMRRAPAPIRCLLGVSKPCVLYMPHQPRAALGWGACEGVSGRSPPLRPLAMPDPLPWQHPTRTQAHTRTNVHALTKLRPRRSGRTGGTARGRRPTWRGSCFTPR